MSLPEPSPCPTSTLPPKLESKFGPSIAQKPCSQTDSPPLEGDACTIPSSGGIVKSIVDRFSHPEIKLTAAEKPTNCAPGPHTPTKKSRRAPTVKPKPGRTTLQQQAGGNQAPPLPLKHRLLRQPSGQAKKESTGGEHGNAIHTRRRSAPDGKEVDLRQNGGPEAEAEQGSNIFVNPCCEKDCGCVCHIKRPGMKLVWVPIGEEEEEDEGEESGLEEEEEEEEEESGGEGKIEAWEEEGERQSSGGDETEGAMVIKNKSKFHHILDGIMAEGNRRRSDPGPHGVLAAVLNKPPQSPPIPPKRTHIKAPPNEEEEEEEEEEEAIYEDTLWVDQPRPQETSSKCQMLGVPQTKVMKSARRVKMSSSSSNPSFEFESDSDTALYLQDSPPAIPPRMPVSQEKAKSLSNLTPVHRGGILLPQPTAEEWRSLRLCSPMSHSASPLTPQRAALPVPEDGRRLSAISGQSFTLGQERCWVNEEEEGGEYDDDDSGTLSRRGRNSGWESRLQDEPLYQTYRATVITKEIRRQTVCRNISKTSADYPIDFGARWGTGTSPTVAPPTPGQTTLWQDLPHVRESGVLETLTPEQCKYQESMFEVLTSEASYLRSLRVLTEHFLDSRDLEDTMIIRDRKNLFSNVLRVREVSERFLKDLEDRMDEDLVFSDINDIIHYHAQHNFPAYIVYVRNQIYQEKTYTSLMKNNAQFAMVITRLQESPQCQRLPFMSFLLLPFQRITRIKMLIENILKRTKEGTKEEQIASKALDSVSKIINECNTQVGKMKQVEELIYISKTLEFDKLKAIPIISQTRFLEKKGELQELSKGGALFNMRGKFIPVQLFLFNDLLIIASKKGTERFVVLDHVHRSLVQVRPFDSPTTNPANEHCFCLTFLENYQGRMIERLLKAPTQSDMHRWVAAFPNPSNPDQDEEEVIYEDWDCPQVQCVEQYIAQQADELTLEPTEIINVVRKTSEGMYEGIRLSDGQKGWFPVANVLEITNEHVRRRNLRERYRVMQVARMVTNAKTWPGS